MFSWEPLGCDSFSDFSCFWWPWELWGLFVRDIIGHPSTGICLIFFITLLRLCKFVRKITEVECHVHHIKGILSTWLTTTDIDLDHLKVKLILIIYFIWSNIFKILSFWLAINIKIISEIFYFLYFTLSKSWCGLCWHRSQFGLGIFSGLQALMATVLVQLQEATAEVQAGKRALVSPPPEFPK